MAQSKQALRARIRSVNSTRKITKAMEMIANAKLFKLRNQMEANRTYAQKMQDMVDEMMVRNPMAESVYNVKNDSPVRLSIVFCSDLGLCGAYNQNVMRQASDSCRKEDPMVVIGTSLYKTLKEELGFHVIHDKPISGDHVTYDTLRPYLQEGLTQYLHGQIGGIQVIYTRFVNTMTFRPAADVLIPAQVHQQAPAGKSEETSEESSGKAETLFIPDEESILNELIPLMVMNVAYSDWLESATAEQGSRRVAMKTATDNADDLSEQLLLDYNKARQAAITQEITEIVGGSEAV